MRAALLAPEVKITRNMRRVFATKARSAPTDRATSIKAIRYIPAKLKREVSRRDENRCSYQDRKTKRVCGSGHALEYDHIVPVCAGGESTVENLRLLCSAHHRLETEKLVMLV